MDEPTNDLDAETLDLLEDMLVEYEGTLLLVSHDREFLDNVVTSTLVFEGEGRIGDYVGGYADWMREKEKQAAALKAGESTRLTSSRSDVGGVPSPRSNPSGPGTAATKTKPARKLTNKEQRELEALPKQIEKLEAEQAELTAKLGDPAFYKKEPAAFSTVKARLDAIEREHATAFARWEELEAARG